MGLERHGGGAPCAPPPFRTVSLSNLGQPPRTRVRCVRTHPQTGGLPRVLEERRWIDPAAAPLVLGRRLLKCRFVPTPQAAYSSHPPPPFSASWPDALGPMSPLVYSSQR